MFFLSRNKLEDFFAGRLACFSQWYLVYVLI